MSRVAVHLHPTTRDLLGVWVEGDGGVPRSAYRVTGYHQQNGTDRWAGRVAKAKGGPTFDDFADYLAECTPMDAWWESVQRRQVAGKPETAAQALARLLAEHPPGSGT